MSLLGDSLRGSLPKTAMFFQMRCCSLTSFCICDGAGHEPLGHRGDYLLVNEGN